MSLSVDDNQLSVFLLNGFIRDKNAQIVQYNFAIYSRQSGVERFEAGQ